MAVKKLIEFLDSNKIKYKTITYSPVYTAQETAATAHISGNELAKTVVIKIDGRMAMAVLPASYKIDIERLRKAAGADKVELAHEKEFENRFLDCDIGAMPPFGNLYGMDVFVAEKLTEDEEIAFNAGSHAELIRVAYRDFERSVKPTVGRFSIK